MIVKGIGVDIEDISRFEEMKLSDPFFTRVYSEKECDYCFSKKNPYPHFTANFCGKEAVIKALTPLGIKLSPNQIEILRGDNQEPIVILSGFLDIDINIHISLSHSLSNAIAFVMIEWEKES